MTPLHTFDKANWQAGVCFEQGDRLLAHLLRPLSAQTQTSGRYWTFKNKNNVLGAPVD